MIVPSFHPFNQSFLQNGSDIHGEERKMYVVLRARISDSHYMLHSALSRELEFRSPFRTRNVCTKQRTAHQSTQKYSNVFCVVAENWQD